MLSHLFDNVLASNTFCWTWSYELVEVLDLEIQPVQLKSAYIYLLLGMEWLTFPLQTACSSSLVSPKDMCRPSHAEWKLAVQPHPDSPALSRRLRTPLPVTLTHLVRLLPEIQGLHFFSALCRADQQAANVLCYQDPSGR